MLIGGAISYMAGRQAVRTVYWRTGNNGRILKTAKTCMFQGPPKPAPSSTSATVNHVRDTPTIVRKIIFKNKS